MIHPDTELRYVNDLIGYGVFATRLIPRGTITWVQDELDQVFPLQKLAQMPELYRRILEKYSFVDAKGQAVLCWDLARYVNHSCAPTCLSAGYNFELAIRDIRPGEELTDDYGTLNLLQPFSCACGTAVCRQWIAPDDMLRYADAWDALVREAFPSIPKVTQSLWPFLSEQA